MLSRPSLLIVGLALVAGIAGLLASNWWFARDPRTGASPATQVAMVVGSRRPELTLKDLDGNAQSTKQFDGRPLLVNFWATWCAPCIEELPRLEAAHARRDDGGIAVLAIALEDDAAAVRAFAEDLQLTLPIWLDPPARNDASTRYGNARSVLPYSVLVDANGTIVDTRMGALDEAELEAMIERVAVP